MRLVDTSALMSDDWKASRTVKDTSYGMSYLDGQPNQTKPNQTSRVGCIFRFRHLLLDIDHIRVGHPDSHCNQGTSNQCSQWSLERDSGELIQISALR